MHRKNEQKTNHAKQANTVWEEQSFVSFDTQWNAQAQHTIQCKRGAKTLTPVRESQSRGTRREKSTDKPNRHRNTHTWPHWRVAKIESSPLEPRCANPYPIQSHPTSSYQTMTHHLYSFFHTKPHSTAPHCAEPCRIFFKNKVVKHGKRAAFATLLCAQGARRIKTIR